MKRRRLISKGSLSRLFEAAAEAWRRQDYQQTIELLERASRLDPANIRLLLDLGRAYGLRYDYAAAETALEKAVRLAAGNVETLADAGRRCQEFGHYDLATAYLERAVRVNNAPASVLVTLAELYERRHRLEEATALVDRALNAQPDHHWSLLARARLLRLQSLLEPAEQQIRTLLPACDPQTRSRAWYELGGILDRQGRFEEAMNAFLEAKALLRPGAAQASKILEGIQARIKEMEASISAPVLNRWAAATADLQPARPMAILCGHPRSGTTLLEQLLDSHPRIVTAEETHILHDEAYLPLCKGFPPSASVLEVLEAAAPSQLRQARENYFRFTELHLRQPLNDRVLIDKNPALNVLIPAVIRILPEAKFLVALRDPRDVCLSCFMQPLAINPVSSAYLTLEGTVRQYVSVMGLWRVLLQRMPNPRLELRYEDAVLDLERVARQCLDFLEVGWDPAVLRFYEHARRKPMRSPTYADVTKPVYQNAVGRWKNYQAHLEPHLPALAPFIEAFGYDS